ncbi:MAG: cation transporter [Akkermansia sp.]|nr:cation transporter [Akkermansia sp.]
MDADTKKAIAAGSSVLWSALLTVMKFIVGIVTGSLGILSEALHSALDMLAALGTYFAVKLAARPADAEHPYGHGRVESLTALAETLLLLITAGWVIMEAIERLTSDSAEALHVETNVWAFVVIIVSLVVDINRAAMLKRVAKETKSDALEADAAHFASDIWSSAAVLLGISGAAVAHMTLEGSWLNWLLLRADVLASLAVAVLILHICWELGCKSINNLMDKTDGESARTVRRLMAERMPAYPLQTLRVREVGNKAYIEMVVAVPRELHVDTAHDISEAIEELISAALPGAETAVHMHPKDAEPDSHEMLVRRIALTHRFGVHGLVLMQSEQGYTVFADLELPGNASLDSWHIAIQAFRKEVSLRLNADRVMVHVEPDLREIPAYATPVPDDWEQLVRQAMITSGAPLPTGISLYTAGNRRFCIITIPQECCLNVQESHERLTAINRKLRSELPAVARIIVVYE